MRLGKFLPACYSSLRKPNYYHQVRMMSSMEFVKECAKRTCKLEKKKSSNTFLLTLTDTGSPEDQHLLNPTLIVSIRELLDAAKEYQVPTPKGSVLISTGEGENFCEGFDYNYAKDGDSHKAYKTRFHEMIYLFKDVVADLISLPMPTIAAINGCASGAGLMLGISHDYLTMKKDEKDKRFLFSDHLSTGMSLPPYFAALIRSKVSRPMDRSDLVLKELHFTAKELGLSDKKHDVGNNAVEIAERLADHLAKIAPDEWNGEVYAESRKALHPELCKELGLTCRTILPNPPKSFLVCL